MTDQPNRPAPLPPIAEPRAVAEAAREQVPGTMLNRVGVGPCDYIAKAETSILARHIATFSPSTVLALLDRVEALEAGLREALEMNEAGGHELSWERLRGLLLDR